MTRAEAFPVVASTEAENWVGRSEERWGCLTPDLAGMMNAAVSHPLSLRRDVRRGCLMPRLWHWAAFPEFVPLSQLGEDGHPKLGDFLPPLAFKRRMWAAGKLSFSGPLRVGERGRRISTIKSVTPKSGGTGDMVFVTVAHQIEGETGSFVEEEQDIVYLHIPDEFKAPKRIPELEGPDFDETVPINEARLFRFSAATFNAHRIHYDLPYAREVEHYPGLIVHGPLQANLLMAEATAWKGRRPDRFSFRGVHPMFAGGDMTLRATRGEGTALRMCTVAAAGHMGMQATADWED